MEEVEAMRMICSLNGIDPLVERSRSGRGAHLWIFFDKPIPATLARRFGFALLEKGAAKRKEQENAKQNTATQGGYTVTGEGDPAIDALVLERGQAKKAKDFARADAIREELKGKGFSFNMDTAAYTDEGKIKNVYLDGEFGGFAIHIMQK